MNANEKRIFKAFLRFLKENKLMKTYEDNLYDYVKKHNYKEYKKANFNIQEYIFRFNRNEFTNNVYSFDSFFIQASMEWKDTIKGFDFWKEIDQKWRYYIMKRKLTDPYLFT